MHLSSNTPHKKARIEIIPLIDIMFFLLASFMLVSMSMLKLQSIKTELPEAVKAEPVKQPGFVVIGITKDGNLVFDKDKDPTTMTDIAVRLQKLYAEKGDDLRVFVNADKSIRYDTLVGVLDMLRNAGIKKISFPTKQPAPHL